MRTPGFVSQRKEAFTNNVNLPFCLRRNSRVAVWNESVFPSVSKPIILDD
jgi:hypothetical protein